MRILSLIILPVLAFLLVSFTTDSPHGDKFKVSCNVCHSPSSWKVDNANYAFDHNTTAMPLTGSHKETNCRSCHTSLVFSEAKTECIDCHTDMHENTTGPDCARCHTPKSWIVENITSLHRQSRFPLVGPHVTAECSQCHKSASLLRFEPQGIECFDCHQANYFATALPNHVQSGMSTNCVECHSMTSFDWSGSGFNHSFFPLTAGHAINECNRCHTNGTYTGLSTECVSCHLDNYNQTTDPNHAAAQYPTNCIQCHSTNPGWKPATFDHTTFPLTSGHALTDCNQCHINGNYTNASPECVSCHLEKYNQTTDPNHIAAQYPTTCNQCHSTNPGWKPATFDHTAFPLTSGHALTDCNLCHINGNYTNTSPECVSCHLEKYNQTTDPNHAAAQYPTTCNQCHSTNPGWKPATFDHTAFPLTSGHALTDCNLCHINGNYTNTSSECVSCHLEKYNQTTDPNHIAAQYPTTCNQCHSTNPGWKPATFDHTAFPLTSGHALTDCNLCHINGNYTNTSSECVSCHLEKYNQTTDPNHIAAQYPTTCNQCHSTNPGWKPATFDHTKFPLTSGHALTDCNLCHINGNYTNTSPECVSCHQTNYNQTTNPNHSSANIPTACASCHTTVPGWKPASFTIHDSYFPIYSGSHRGEWNTCADCHTNTANWASFTCIDCHEHNQTSMNDKHNDVGDYSWNSQACFQCHPTGGGGD